MFSDCISLRFVGTDVNPIITPYRHAIGPMISGLPDLPVARMQHPNHRCCGNRSLRARVGRLCPSVIMSALAGDTMNASPSHALRYFGDTQNVRPSVLYCARRLGTDACRSLPHSHLALPAAGRPSMGKEVSSGRRLLLPAMRVERSPGQRNYYGRHPPVKRLPSLVDVSPAIARTCLFE